MGYRIAQIGSFDVENYGDLLFADVFSFQLAKRLEIDEIIYFAPKNCIMPNREEQVYSVTELEQKAMEKKIDAIIVGGGDLIHLVKIKTNMPHISQEWLDYEALYMWIIPCVVAHKYNIPLLWNAVGVPLEFTDESKKIVSLLCEMVDYISVRDYEAKNQLAEAVKTADIKVVPDTVLSIRDVFPKEKLLSVFEKLPFDIESEKYVFFQANMTLTEEERKTCGDVLLKIKEATGFKVILQPIGYALGDEEILHDLNEMYPGQFILSTERLNQYEILALVSNAALYIGTSLHGCITANSYGVDNIVYNFKHYNKVDGFVSLIGIAEHRVYSANEIWDKYKAIGDKQDCKNAIREIGEHFDNMATMIRTTYKRNNINFPKNLAECIFSMNKISELHKDELAQERKELIRLRKEFEQLNSAYVNVINSKMWRVTKPIRQVLNWIKLKK